MILVPFSTIANVTFFDNDINKNTIQNDFVAGFTNSDIQHNIEMKSNMNNIWPSKSFFNNAVNFYKQVANYVDTGKILVNAESNQWLTDAIDIELYILCGIVAFLFLCTIIRYKFFYRNGELVNHDRVSKQDTVNDILHSMINIFFLGVATLILLVVWEFAVGGPIKTEVDKIKKWNDAIKEKSQYSSDKKINVIDKVNGDDKKNFESIDNFTSYYEKKSNTAFESYFYYFHFVELSQNQKNNEQATILDNKVKKDYDDFNETKNGFELNDRDVARIIIGIIPIFIIIYGLFMVIMNVLVTILVISDYFAHVANNVGQNINNNLNNAQHQIHRLPVVDEGDNNNIAI